MSGSIGIVSAKVRKKEEGRRLKSLKKRKFPVDIHPWFYTNDTSGHDIRKQGTAVRPRIGDRGK